MLKVIRRHWGLFLAISVCLVLACLYFLGNFIDNYDAAGHRIMIDSMQEFWPWPIGWDNSTFLGHMYGEAYPMFLHWIMTGLSFITGTDYAVRILVSISLITLPISIYWYKDQNNKSSFAILSTLIIMFLLPGYIGSNFSGIFTYGLVPSFIVMPIFFTLLGCINRINKNRKFLVWSIILFSIIIWSHLVVAIVAGVFILAKLLGKNTSSTRNKLLFIIVSGGIIGLPLVISTLVDSSSTIQSSSGIATLFTINITLLLLSLAAIWKFNLWHKSVEARTAVILLAFLCITPLLIRLSSFSLIHHAYRLQLFAYIFIGLSIIYSVKISQKSLRNVSILFTICFILLSTYKIIDLSRDQAVVEIKSVVAGRFIESFRRTESFPTPYAGQQRLVKQGGEWVNGLFSESAPNAPFVQSLMKSLRPEAYKNLGTGLDEVIKDTNDTKKMLSIFGISHIISLDENSKQSIGSLKIGPKILYYHDQNIGEQSSVEALNPKDLKPIKNNWNKAVSDWWRNPISNYLYDASKGEILESSQTARNIKIIEDSRTKIIIDIESENAAPVLIKRTFSSSWVAKNSSGKSVKIYKFSPFLMMIEGKGRITLSI